MVKVHSGEEDLVLGLLQRLDERMDRLEISTSRNSSVLEEHIRRTEAAEGRLDRITDEIAPLKTHVAVMGGVAKALGLLGTVVGVITGIAKLLGLI